MVLAGKSSIWNITADRKPCSRDRAPGLTARASPDLNAIMHMQSPEPSSPLCKVARQNHASVFQAKLPASSIHLPAPSLRSEHLRRTSSPKIIASAISIASYPFARRPHVRRPARRPWDFPKRPRPRACVGPGTGGRERFHRSSRSSTGSTLCRRGIWRDENVYQNRFPRGLSRNQPRLLAYRG